MAGLAEGTYRPVVSQLLIGSHFSRLFRPRSHGFVVGHVVPEAQVGGPIALVRDGDIISIDAFKNTIDLDVPVEEMNKRRAAWKAPPLKVGQGSLYKYARAVSDASHGCITDGYAE